MIAAQTVFLTLDRSQAVPEGDSAAQFLLVRKGQEISEAEAKKYPGAMELISAPVAEPAAPIEVAEVAEPVTDEPKHEKPPKQNSRR